MDSEEKHPEILIRVINENIKVHRKESGQLFTLGAADDSLCLDCESGDDEIHTLNKHVPQPTVKLASLFMKDMDSHQI